MDLEGFEDLVTPVSTRNAAPVASAADPLEDLLGGDTGAAGASSAKNDNPFGTPEESTIDDDNPFAMDDEEEEETPPPPPARGNAGGRRNDGSMSARGP